MLHDFAKVTVGVVVEADLGEVEVADGMDVLTEDAKVVVDDVHQVTENSEVVILVHTYFVEVVTMAEAVAGVVGWTCSITPSVCFG